MAKSLYLGIIHIKVSDSYLFNSKIFWKGLIMDDRIISPYVRMTLPFRPIHNGVIKIMPERRLLDYHLFIIEKGEGSITVDNREVLLKEGDICLIPPGIKHYFSLSGGVYPYVHFDLYYNPLRHKSFIVSGGKCDFTDEEKLLMQPFIFNYDNNYPFRIPLTNVEDYLEKFYQLIDIFAEMPTYYEATMQKLVLELMSPFFDYFLRQNGQQISSDIDIKLQKAIMYIRANLFCKISLPELSKVAALSSSHLSHLFKQEFSMGPIAYHRRCRLQAAAEVLIKSQRNIQEVAYDFGFDNALNFSRAFKEEFKTSPKFYRQQA